MTEPTSSWPRLKRAVDYLIGSALLGAVGVIVGAIQKDALVSAISVAVLLASTRWGVPMLWNHQKLNRRWWPGLPQGEVFSICEPSWSSGAVTQGRLFERDEDVQAIKTRLLKPVTGVVHVTGPSGAGKSCLLQMVLEKVSSNLGSKTKQLDLRYDSPEGSRPDVVGRLQFAEQWLTRQSGSVSAPVILVLDQFEEVINELCDSDGNDGETRTVLLRLLDVVRRDDTKRLVIVTPSDKHYDMDECDLGVTDEIKVRGIDSDKERSFVAGWFTKIGFRKVEAAKIIETLASEPLSRETRNAVSPLTLQLVGYELERRNCLRSKYDWPRPFLAVMFGDHPKWRDPSRTQLALQDYKDRIHGFGGTRSIIDGFFDRLVKASPYPDVTTEVLFSMSSQVHGGSLSVDTLANLSLLDERKIVATLEFLGDSGVCRKTPAGWSIRHDLLRKYAKEWTGQVMRPTLRDNLAHGLHALEAGAGASHALQRLTSRFHPLTPVLALLAIAMFGFVAFRLDTPTLSLDPKWRGPQEFFQFSFLAESPAPYAVNPAWKLDYHYLPAALLQFAWGMYVFVLVRRILWPIGHALSWLRAVSVMLVALVVFGLVATAFVPSLWLMWHGAIGTVLGIPFVVIAVKIRPITKKLWGNEFWSIGYRTVMLNVPCVWAGAQLMPLLKWDLADTPNPIRGLLGFDYQQSINQGLAVVGLLVFFSLYGRHASPTRCRELVGMFHRSDSRRQST